MAVRPVAQLSLRGVRQLMPAARERLFSWVGLALIQLTIVVAIGYWLRISHIGLQSIWYDEGYSIALAQRSIADIWGNVSPDHVPLFFWLLHYWMHLVGSSEFATRYLSLVASVLALPLTYKVSRLLTSHAVAMIATVLSVISPFYVYYAQEVRMYSLMLALTLLVVLSFQRLWLSRGIGSWILHLVSATALVYTHYYGLFVLLFLTTVAGVAFLGKVRVNGRLRYQPRPRLRAWVAAQLVVAALYAPWAWRSAHVFNDFVAASQAALTPIRMFWNMATTFAVGHSVERLNASAGDFGFTRDHDMALLFSSIFLIPLIVGLLYTARSLRDLNANHFLLPLWLLLPAVVVYIISVGKRDFTARHLIVSAPAYYLLIGIGLFGLRRLSRFLPPAAVILLLLISAYSLGNYYRDGKYARDDMRGAAAYVQAHPVPNQAIVFDAGYFSQTFNYYYDDEKTPWYGLPERYPPDTPATLARLDQLGKQYGYLWLVLWQDYYSDPERTVETFLDTNYIRTDEQSFHGNIKVRGYSTLPVIAADAAGATLVNQQLGDAAELVGYKGGSLAARDGEELRFTLLWRALHPLTADYTVFVHLKNLAGQLIAQADGPPAFGHLPSSSWPVGSIVLDEHHVSLPAFTPPGDYVLDVGLYDRQTMRNVGAGGIDHVSLPVRVKRAGGGSVPNPLSVDFGQNVRLRGYELKGDLKPGGTLKVDLLWAAKNKVPDDLTVFIHILDARGQLVAQSDAKPAAGHYPVTVWQPGETVRDGHLLVIPESLLSGEYSIEVGVYDSQSGKRLTYRPWPWSRQQSTHVLRKLALASP